MSKKFWMVTATCVLAVLFVANGLYAAKEVPDVIKMDNKAYAAHEKGIVEFNHKIHSEDYAAKNPELYKNGCGECHHDDKGKPLADLKTGDDVQSCVECHKSTDKISKEDKKLPKKEKINKYHKEALHANCKGCHKAFNKKMGLKKKDPGAAPTTCKECHPKKAK